MTMDKNTVKVFFGLLIFMFSLSLAYFSASYTDAQVIMDYWVTLAIFGGAYILVGIFVYQVFPVSLGFLFSADILLLHLLMENFGDIPSMVKAITIAVILLMLYGFAWVYMEDEPSESTASAGPPQVPPSVPPTLPSNS